MKKQLFIWLISQSENDSYESYDSFVVSAYTYDEAVRMYPSGGAIWNEESEEWKNSEHGFSEYAWTHIKNVQAKVIGIAYGSIEPYEVIAASFNAG